MRFPALILSLLIFACPSFAQILEPPEHFSAEDKAFANSVTLPEGAESLLLKDDEVHRLFGKAKTIPAKNLLIAKIQLNGPDEMGYVVMGTGRLINAKQTPFWILRTRGNGLDLLLHVSAHDLMLRTTISHGLRDLETVTFAPSTLSIDDYHFDGVRYQLHHSTTEKIK